MSHPLFTFYAGDTWKIETTLQESNGFPIPLDGVTIEWMLVDENRITALITEDVTIEVVDSDQGRVRIVVGKDKSDIPSGNYTDVLRITTLGGERYTMLTGQIEVEALDWRIRLFSVDLPTIGPELGSPLGGYVLAASVLSVVSPEIGEP